MECEISNKMQRKIYIDKKSRVAHAVIKATEVARVCFMVVLTFDRGWLEAAKYTPDNGVVGLAEVHIEIGVHRLTSGVTMAPGCGFLGTETSCAGTV